tara:strand:+ start:195 stop:326 length:132 start_codon:yes stop_codon:yes gene_type:complete
MARTENEISRDSKQTNLLVAILEELQKLNANISKSNTGGKNAK